MTVALKYSAVILLTFTMMLFGQSTESRITALTNFQIDSLLTEVSELNLSVTDRMKFFSEMFLGMPYDLTCAGDGPYALYETKPLLNFEQTNCMVFCEHVLALSISDTWDNFFNNLQQIRYKDGIIGMRTRNHYTMGDWLPENSWLLNDVSAQVGEEHAISLTRTISHENFFKEKGIDDMRYVLPDREMTINYIPFDALSKVKKNIISGDILSLIFADKDNIFSAHMLMAYNIDGELFIRESAMSKMTTFDTPFDEWVAKYLNSERYAGVAFMRVREDVNQPGKIILPWEISELKNN